MNFCLRLPYGEVRVIYKRELPNNLILPKQIHSDKVYAVDYNDIREVEADALITERRGIYIGVKTADCLAIALLCENKAGIIHAGWRGLLKGIIEETALYFNNPSGTYVFLSPSAGVCCYEVGDEFKKYFSSSIEERGKIFLDLKREARFRLEELGFKRIIDFNLCTICTDRLPSFRREGTKERMFTIARLG